VDDEELSEDTQVERKKRGTLNLQGVLEKEAEEHLMANEEEGEEEEKNYEDELEMCKSPKAPKIPNHSSVIEDVHFGEEFENDLEEIREEESVHDE